jgi:hypothetical protein
MIQFCPILAFSLKIMGKRFFGHLSSKNKSFQKKKALSLSHTHSSVVYYASFLVIAFGFVGFFDLEHFGPTNLAMKIEIIEH